jgi:hypothetical protein
MGVAECTVLVLEEECDDLVGTASSSFSEMLYTFSKVYKFPNFAKTRCKTCAWNVKVPSNK